MIPSILSYQVEKGVKDFLRTSFAVSTPFFHGMLDRFLVGNGNLFKGPYLSLGLPFREGSASRDFFPDIPLGVRPYLHQEQAFDRLAGARPQSTIVATGTGSGKTECFLYPILDHCYQHRSEKGIKAIIIYPMNALASDQAGRIARTIWNNPKLKTTVRAGLYVGQGERNAASHMSEKEVIANKETMRLHPPDILLTNYKMLDYLLIRPQDAPLWVHNTPETLRYLVVDEFHTFDGAQGTDLGCLLRRLKARLKAPKGHICCVGTSATLGGQESIKDLTEYAGHVFDEPFDQDAIIGEARIAAGEFLEDSLISRTDIIPSAQKDELLPDNAGSYEEYLRRQLKLWFDTTIPAGDFKALPWRITLARELKEHLFFQNLLKVMKGKVRPYEEIIPALERVTPALAEGDPEYKALVIDSILALASEARVFPKGKTGEEQEVATVAEAQPFLHVRHQLWLREMRRMIASVSREPALRFANDLNEQQLKEHLPVLHCRECGSMGWGGLKKRHESVISTDLQSFYIEFFKRKAPKVIRLFPETESTEMEPDKSELRSFCLNCLHLGPDSKQEKCSVCGKEDLLKILTPDGPHQNCPFCGAHNSLTLLGYQAASLTSVMVSQLFASGFNDDKKLLTFSDNVQDAAHRAGFFGARTFRFNLRAAMQQYAQDKGAGQHLGEFGQGFIDYWSGRLNKEHYVSTFIAPNMTWFQDYDILTNSGTLPEGSRLPKDVNKRLGWEILSEFGFSARIGRTLERSGCSIAHVDQEVFEPLVDELLLVLQNEIGELRGLARDQLARFCLGLIMQLKNKGAVHAPMLDRYVEQWGKEYLISQKFIPWMPSFGPKTRTPNFLTTKRGVSRFDHLFSSQGRPRTWYELWAFKCFGDLSPWVPSLVEPLYAHVLKRLTASGILEERFQEHHRVWGIRPETLKVGTNVHQMRCARCGHNISVASHEADIWAGAPCIRRNCAGRYENEPPLVDYYGTLYSTGDVERLFAHEHTGLLKREEREQVEARFKAEGTDRKPWYPNLLSCTPTLEMGIDIGSLSSTIQCSVPPSQAGYLQRIGRAGRRDGNALNMTIANAKPHDLYFYTEPLEMLAGDVETPGVFLDASAVLERQFTAFCFDQWVDQGIPESAVPAKIKTALAAVEGKKLMAFPYNLLTFIEHNRTTLLESFFGLFGDSLSPSSQEHIGRFAEGDDDLEGSLRHKILEGLFELSKERKSLRSRIRRLADLIRKKKADPARDQLYEDELDKLEREKAALNALLKNINDKNTYNFFTDEGLLPNYAFPEAGIVLQSIIWRRNERAGTGKTKYETLIFEYERAAQAAIQELAPANSFYAGGRRVQVDQIDMNVSTIEPWRLCAECSHMEIAASAENRNTCPTCGNAQWSDQGRLRQMVRMRQVFANTPDRYSRISDDSDVREPQFYNKQMLVDTTDKDITQAFRIDDEHLAFGFEFLSRAVFREINFGLKDNEGDLVAVAGEEFPRCGFVICRHCGKIQKHDGKIDHAITCPARDKQSEDNLTDCVYLYREFSSEAIKILLPMSSFEGTESRLHSFVAALNLGLKKHFRGSIDHLQTTIHSEPVPDSHLRKQYLVLYDKIPGGTGYLKELMRSDRMMRVLELALETLTGCPCNHDEAKDGCYACLFAYRNSYTMPETSRDSAVDLLQEILQRRDKLITIDTLRNVPITGLLESELEALFVEALKRAKKKGYETTLKKEVVNGKPGYFFSICGQPYFIEPQVELGPGHGVKILSRADFVISPAREKSALRPIAVFTDGYSFHKDRVGMDMAQRMAIVHSGRFLTWSLTWKDVRNQLKCQGDYFVNYLGPDKKPYRNSYADLFKKFGLDGASSGYHKVDSFEMLLELLKKADEKVVESFSFIEGLINLDFHNADQTGWSQKVIQRAHSVFSHEYKDDVIHPSADIFGLFIEENRDDQFKCLQIFFSSTIHAVSKKDSRSFRIACYFDDENYYDGYERYWNSFLRLYNVYQFLPFSFFVTSRGLREGAYDQLKWPSCVGVQECVAPQVRAVAVNAQPTGAAGRAGWQDVFELTDARLHDFLNKLASKGITTPTPGYELVGKTGEVIATAELAWESQKLGLLTQEELDFEPLFTDEGWRVFPLEKTLEEPGILDELLTK